MTYRYLITFLGLACASAAAAQGPSIERLLSAPFPTQLTAHPLGGAYAWVADSAGRENVYIAEEPEELPIQLTAYGEDDGQAISELTWLSDGNGLVYVRGLANERTIWLFPIPAGVPQRIGAGSGLAVAPAHGPAAGRIAFLRDGQIWWAPSDGGGGGGGGGGGRGSDAKQLIHTQDEIGHLRWSPTGSALAFVSADSGHASIGVYDVARDTVRYLAPSAGQDRDPIWSPDGQRVVFARTLAGEPWSLWVADATTGTGRAVWTASRGAGSEFRELELGESLFWTAGNRIVFPWKGNGWLRLYAIAPEGGAAQMLVPGSLDFDVDEAALTIDRRTVLFTSNQGDPDRRHLWRIDVSGNTVGAPEQVTTGAGIEWSPVAMPDASEIVCLHSDARTPAHPVVVVGDGTRDLWPIPPGYPSDALVTPQDVSFRSSDGLVMHGELFVPRDMPTASRHPAIVFVHDGPERRLLLGFHSSAYYHNAYAFNQYLASRGYIVLSTGAGDYAHVVTAVQYLRGRQDVDPARIGAWGQPDEDLHARPIRVMTLIFPDQNHALFLHSQWIAAYHAASDFFDRMLGGKR